MLKKYLLIILLLLTITITACNNDIKTVSVTNISDNINTTAVNSILLELINNKSIIVINGDELKECRSIRAEIYPKYKDTDMSFSKEDLKVMFDYKNKMSTIYNITSINYLLDMESCALFNKNTDARNKINQFRQQYNER